MHLADAYFIAFTTYTLSLCAFSKNKMLLNFQDYGHAEVFY